MNEGLPTWALFLRAKVETDGPEVQPLRETGSPSGTLRSSAVNTYSLGRGRKKAVKKFTSYQGLWMSLMIGGAMLGMLLLFLLGFFHVD